MKIQSLFSLGLFAVVLLSIPAPTSAQGCFECELNSCVPADWHGAGKTQCGYDEHGWCALQGDLCWGPDPGRFALAVRADGTLITPVTNGEASAATSMEFATAESASLFAVARSYERNCKGLITRRVYGEAELAELARRTKHLTI